MSLPSSQIPSAQPRFLPILAAAAGGILLVFAGLTLGVSWATRAHLHHRLIQREAETLHALSGLAWDQANARNPGLSASFGADLLLGETMLTTAAYRDVLGVRAYDPAGTLLEAVPFSFFLQDPTPADFAAAHTGHPTARFLSADSLANWFLDPSTPEALPLLSVLVPVLAPPPPADPAPAPAPEPRPGLSSAPANTPPPGFLFFLLDGARLQADLALLDSRLFGQTLAIFLGGGFLLLLVLGLAGWRLRHAQNLIRERTQALLAANAELTLAAKTQAIGSLTAHLLHGLKNPLSGLRLFVDQAGRDSHSPFDPEELRHAAESTRRMQDLIEEVVSILREDGSSQAWSLSWAELRSTLLSRVEGPAARAGVIFHAGPAPEGEIDSRRAQILLLILYNLIQNALEASSPALPVHLRFLRDGDWLTLEVCDQGPGLPPGRLQRPFEPGPSAKPGGSGLGLAISHHLARHIGARLELVRSNSNGACFSLSLPLSLPQPALV